MGNIIGSNYRTRRMEVTYLVASTRKMGVTYLVANYKENSLHFNEPIRVEH